MRHFFGNTDAVSSPVEAFLLRQLNAEINYSEKYDPDAVTRRAVAFLRVLSGKIAPGKINREERVRKMLRSCMPVVDGGGGLLSRIFCSFDEWRTIRYIARLDGEDVPVFLFAQGLGPFSGATRVLEAFDRLRLSGVEAKLVVIGDSVPFGRMNEHRIRNHARYGKDIFWIREVTRGEWSKLTARCFLLFGCATDFVAEHSATSGPERILTADGSPTVERVFCFNIREPLAIEPLITTARQAETLASGAKIRTQEKFLKAIEAFHKFQFSAFQALVRKTSNPACYNDPDSSIRARQFVFASVFFEATFRDDERLGRFANIIYSECRNFYWTCERLVKWIRCGIRSPAPDKRKYPDWIDTVSEMPAGGSRHRYLVDVTPTLANDLRTGIQRVVREVSARISADGRGIAVFIRDGEFFRWRPDLLICEKVTPHPGDRLLLLDAGWMMIDEYRTAIDMAKRSGAETIVCLYDLFPLDFGPVFPAPVQETFRRWFDEVIVPADCVAAISNTVVDDYKRFCAANRVAVKSGQQVVVWTLGADFSGEKRKEATSRSEMLAHAGRPYFLSVGTLGVTKGHGFIVDVFEDLWANGTDVACVIVGRPGWGTRALQARMRSHPEFGRRLFWFPDASDAELSALYGNARGLICASLVEGFGLPLVEGIAKGLPVLASDIPIFREVGARDVCFFELLDRGSLAGLIKSDPVLPSDRHVSGVLSWRDASSKLIDALELR